MDFVLFWVILFLFFLFGHLARDVNHTFCQCFTDTDTEIDTDKDTDTDTDTDTVLTI